jgi:hypothetical protein
VDWWQCAAVMQREAVTVMPSCSGGGNVVVVWHGVIFICQMTPSAKQWHSATSPQTFQTALMDTTFLLLFHLMLIFKDASNKHSVLITFNPFFFMFH